MPALLMTLPGVLGKFQKRLSKSERYAGGPLLGTVATFLEEIKGGSVARLLQLWSLGTSLREKHRAAWKQVWTDELPQLAGELPNKVRVEIARLDPEHPAGKTAAQAARAAAPKQPKAKAASATGKAAERVAASVAGTVARGLATSATRRVWTGRYDSRGKKIMRTVAARAVPAAAPAAAAVGGASAAAVAGVVIGGLAVGLAIGTALRKLFGEARAVKQEEAAAKSALALRTVRQDVERKLKRKVTAAEARKMFESHEANLVALGFEQDAAGMWFRPRNWWERLLG